MSKLSSESSQRNAASYDFKHEHGAQPPAHLSCSDNNPATSIIIHYATLWGVRKDSNDGSRASNIQSELEEDDYTGALVSDTSLFAYWTARDYLSGKTKVVEQSLDLGKSWLLTLQALVPPGTPPSLAPNYHTPVAFYAANENISKTMALLGVRSFYQSGRETYPSQCPITQDRSWPEDVPSDVFGCMIIPKLAQLVEFFAERGHPILVSLKHGSGDDVEKITETLEPIFERHGILERPLPFSVRHGYWIHVDADEYMAHLKQAQARGSTYRDGSPVTSVPDVCFNKVHSIATGSVYLSKIKSDVPQYFREEPDILVPKLNDVTNLWIQLSKGSLQEDIKTSMDRLEAAVALEKGLRKIGDELGVDLWVQRAPVGLSVVFQELNPDLVKKHKITTRIIAAGEELRRYSIANDADEQKVDSLLLDVKAAGVNAFASLKT